MRTPTPTCAAIWNDISIRPFPKTRPITNTLWKVRTTCPLTSNRQFSAVRFRYRWDAAAYSSAPGRESTFANIATTAARDGWWRRCTEREAEGPGDKGRGRQGDRETRREGQKSPSLLVPPLLVFLPISTPRHSNASSFARSDRSDEWLFENRQWWRGRCRRIFAGCGLPGGTNCSEPEPLSCVPP